MGLGKKKPELNSELFRSTEPAAQIEKSRQEPSPRVRVAETDVANKPKERFSLYLDQETAKGLRVYAAEHGIKNISLFVNGLIERFLEEHA